jgi:WXG100 family type VII secretion target
MAMAANVSVTYDDMTQAATKLTTGQDEITTKLSDLKAFIGTLLTNGFVTDQASVAFNETYTTFTDSATKVVSSLTDLSSYLNNAATTLADVDSQLAAGLRG